MMQVDDSPARKLPAGRRGEDAHVTGQDDVVDVVRIEDFDQFALLRSPRRVPNHVPRDTKLLRNASARVTVTHHDRDAGWDVTITNGT